MEKRYWIGGGVAALVIVASLAGGGDADDDTTAAKSKTIASGSSTAKGFPSATSTLTPSSTPTPSPTPTPAAVVQPASYSRDDVVKQMRHDGYSALKNNEGLNAYIEDSCDIINNRPLTGPVVQEDRKAWLKLIVDKDTSTAYGNAFVDTLYKSCRDLGYSKVWVKPLTVSQENAIGAAENYLSFAGFSRDGLIEQLSSDFGDGYSEADATYAVDHVEVDWNKEAVESARNYLSFTNFSRSGLIEQLSSSFGDQYTVAQATYAANKVGL